MIAVELRQRRYRLADEAFCPVRPSVAVDSGASLNVGVTSGASWLDLRGLSYLQFATS